MCQPDLTVEVKDDKRGGVTGFGTVHTCKDWDQLKAWMSTWETNRGLALSSDPRKTHAQ